MHYHALRVINEDRVAPGGGFPTHPHENMEILTYILKGALEHKDSMGNGSVINPGDIQYMSAGTGVRHSEFNHAKDEEVCLLQIWIMPNEVDAQPRYGQLSFTNEAKFNQWCALVSTETSNTTLTIRQDVNLYASILETGKKLSWDVVADRACWIQLATGSIDVRVGLESFSLEAGDGLAVELERMEITGKSPSSEFLLFDLTTRQ